MSLVSVLFLPRWFGVMTLHLLRHVSWVPTPQFILDRASSMDVITDELLGQISEARRGKFLQKRCRLPACDWVLREFSTSTLSNHHSKHLAKIHVLVCPMDFYLNQTVAYSVETTEDSYRSFNNRTSLEVPSSSSRLISLASIMVYECNSSIPCRFQSLWAASRTPVAQLNRYFFLTFFKSLFQNSSSSKISDVSSSIVTPPVRSSRPSLWSKLSDPRMKCCKLNHMMGKSWKCTYPGHPPFIEK